MILNTLLNKLNDIMLSFNIITALLHMTQVQFEFYSIKEYLRV